MVMLTSYQRLGWYALHAMAKASMATPHSDGMSMSELHEQDHWDDDFMDGYMSGRYDVTCEECKGRTTVKGYNLSQLTPELLEEYFADVREIATQRYEDFKTYQAEMGYRPY